MRRKGKRVIVAKQNVTPFGAAPHCQTGNCQWQSLLDFHSGFGGMYAETDESRRFSHFSGVDSRMRSMQATRANLKKVTQGTFLKSKKTAPNGAVFYVHGV
jgi:hypothetical protein